jgi:oligopeptide transport system substrate-binding protein
MADAAAGSTFRETAATASSLTNATGDYYGVSSSADYQANVAEAQKILAEQGYPGGQGFPTVEYMYNTNEGNRAIAEAIQAMWQENLGVTVTLSNQDWAVFLETRKQGDYIGAARDGWIGDYNDPINFLDMFTTGNGNNNAAYSSQEYDDLIAAIKSETDPTKRFELLHQAEDKLVGTDWAIMPIYYYTSMVMYNPKVSGLFYTPLGYYFFYDAKVQR